MNDKNHIILLLISTKICYVTFTMIYFYSSVKWVGNENSGSIFQYIFLVLLDTSDNLGTLAMYKNNVI